LSASQVRNAVGDGARWGLSVTVKSEKRERTIAEARAKYVTNDRSTWLPAPNDVILADHLPGLPRSPLFTSYADWFAAVRTWTLHAMTPDRIGLHELRPGVWAGLHARIALNVKLIGPCWIGDYVWIEAGATIGPDAVLEKEAFVARGASVSASVIGPKTFVGQFTEIRNSIAWGCTLINWERDSCLKVTDEFLLCSLEPPRARQALAETSGMPRLREYVSQFLTSAFGKSDPPQSP